MTVKELMQKLKNVDENLEVFIIQENAQEFASTPAEVAELRNILFTENPEDDEAAELATRDYVFIITDEI